MRPKSFVVLAPTKNALLTLPQQLIQYLVAVPGLYPKVYVCIFSLVYQNRLLPLYNLFISDSWRQYSCIVTNVTVFTFFLVKCHKLSKTRIWHSQTVTLIEMLTPFYSGGPTKQHPVICSAHTAPRGTLPGINALISIFTLTPIWRAWTNVCPLL